MTRIGTLAVAGALLAALALAPAAAFAKKDPHQKIEHYEGTKTCIECHEDETRTFFHSQHYQWQGETPQLVNGKGRTYGKINTINDFCTNPLAGWIGEVKNADGQTISTGCSNCHAGFGLKPSREESQEQLENIDCLICHAQGYRRTLVQTNGEWQWKPLLWKNQEGLDSVARRISQPTRAMCLRCHAASGGGPNWKRGDLEYRLADTDRAFDVHMGKDGENMQCVKCHAGKDHRVAGRGADLPASDRTDAQLRCDGECHGTKPHKVAALDGHAQRVDCNVCHVPTLARDEATDMKRDWSKVAWVESRKRHGPEVLEQKNVKPVYAWYDGRTQMQLPGVAVTLNSSGEVVMAAPVATRRDRNAKIHAFKLHRAVMPVTKDSKWLLPIAVEECFSGTPVDEGVKAGAKQFYGIEDVQYTWMPTVRYMGVYHAVPPKAQALQCLDCHRPGGRMDWKALGYRGDPLDERFAGR